ncbi:META domain-containing protein [Phyllobacterium sp. K27]
MKDRTLKGLALISMLTISMVPAFADAPPSPAGKWLAEDIGGRGVVDNLQTTLEIADSRASGRGGCNRYSAAIKVEGDTVSIGPAMSTKMACAAAVMDQEQKFFSALEKVEKWKLDGTKLVLMDSDGSAILKFSALD